MACFGADRAPFRFDHRAGLRVSKDTTVRVWKEEANRLAITLAAEQEQKFELERFEVLMFVAVPE